MEGWGSGRDNPGLIRGRWGEGLGQTGPQKFQETATTCKAMGRGLNSTRLRRQKRRLRLRVQKPRRQPEVSGHQGYDSQACCVSFHLSGLEPTF